MTAEYDAGLENLLTLDGEVFFVDEAGNYTVKCIVKKIPATKERPHGLSYSLTLHGENGERIVGFDNAHPVRKQSGPAGKSSKSYDHKHRIKTIRPYEYKDAESLLIDFWEQVDAMLKEKGVIK